MGILIAIVITLSWGIHLIYMFLHVPLDPGNLMFWVHLFLQIWLFTGLFITSHDAMHGSVSKSRFVNNGFGAMASFLYAGLWYPKLLQKHKLHHLYPATDRDPDYTTGNQKFFVWWYRFMRQYVTIWQLLIMAILFNIGLVWFNEKQLILLWVIPSIASTFQLFYFGTFIPHRLPHTEEMGPDMSRSQRKNHFWAMMTCYFFGYHSEHHAFPHTPWWQLYRFKM